MDLYGGIEAGGTKFVCAVGRGPDNLREIRFPTTTPQETLARAIDFFSMYPTIRAVGIGSFGPLDPNLASETYGHITTTPKQGWANTDFAGTIRRALGVPVAFDTDVNAAALGEHRWGAAQDVDTFLYLTVGTGIGGGAMIEGRLHHGLIHPEMGHLLIPHNLQTDPFPGLCPYHGDCWEGLASGPAIQARWKQPAENLPAGHPAWELEAHYLALGLANLTLAFSPQRIVIGGGVMHQTRLYQLVHSELRVLLNGYVRHPVLNDPAYIVPPGLGEKSGILGALALAQSLSF